MANGNSCTAQELTASATNGCGQNAYCRICPLVGGRVDESRCEAFGLANGQTDSSGMYWCNADSAQYVCVPFDGPDVVRAVLSGRWAGRGAPLPLATLSSLPRLGRFLGRSKNMASYSPLFPAALLFAAASCSASSSGRGNSDLGHEGGPGGDGSGGTSEGGPPEICPDAPTTCNPQTDICMCCPHDPTPLVLSCPLFGMWAPETGTICGNVQCQVHVDGGEDGPGLIPPEVAGHEGGDSSGD